MAAARRERPASGMALVGEPGIGKTSLARRFLDEVATEGADTVWIGATRTAAAIPFGAFAPLLAASESGADDPAGVDVLARAIEAVRARPGLVLVVDDAPSLDAGSATLLHQIALDTPTFVVITVRRDDSPPDAVVALWKDGLLDRIDLQALAVHEVDDLLFLLIGGPVEASVARRVADVSGGNPLYVRELVEAAIANGHLVTRRGVWSWVGPLAAGTRLVELVEQRLSGLDPGERDLVELVAYGEPLPFTAVRRLDPAGRLADLEGRGLVTVDRRLGRSDVRLGHPLYGEVLRSVPGEARRRTAHRRLADALDTVEIESNDRLRLVVWRLDGGEPVDPERLVDAAREAIRRQDQPLAERIARAAADAGGGNAALVELAESLYWQQRHPEVEQLVGQIDVSESPPAEQVRLAVCQASNRFWGLGRADDALAVLETVADLPGGDEAFAHAALIELLAGRTDRGRSRAETVLARADLTPRGRARAYGAFIQALALGGRPDDAVSATVEGMDAVLAIWSELPTPTGGVIVGQYIGLLLSGRFDELFTFADHLHADSIAKDVDDFRGVWTFMVGRAALANGRLDEAQRRLAEAVALLDHRDVGQLRPWCFGCLAQVAGQAGRADEAVAAAAAARADLGAIVVWEVEVVLGEAWAAWAAGEGSRARELAVAAADVAASAGQTSSEVLALHDALRLGEAAVAGRLTSVAAGVQGEFAATAAAHALALGDGPGLDRSAARFAALGAHLAAAECALEAAAAHRVAGRTGSALTSAARADEHLSGLGRVGTPSVVAGRDRPELALLTAREREVAGLAASGMTKREIADRLYLSVRTVGNHLNHVYGKLGLGDRDQLAAVLGDLSDPQ